MKTNSMKFASVAGIIEQKALALDAAEAPLPDMPAIGNPVEAIEMLILVAAQSSRYAVDLIAQLPERERQILIGTVMICSAAQREETDHCGDCRRNEDQERLVATEVGAAAVLWEQASGRRS